MKQSDIRKCRESQIRALAARKDGDEFAARFMYNRCVRYCKRYFRWGEMRANGSRHYSKYQWQAHEHEGELLEAYGKRLNHELDAYGLKWEYPGLYPVLVDKNNNHDVELFWY